LDYNYQITTEIMVEPYKIFGRLGNQMFQYATLTALASEAGTDIYFQDTKWFEMCIPQIKQMFGTGIGSVDKVAIHVRRGDYLLFDHQYPNLLDTTDYYQKAMEEFPDAQFIVFSDDIEHCKKQDIFKNCEFSEGKSEVQDLNLMASCQGIITANSSFSWWGAFLGPEDKKVVCPRIELWGTPISLPTNWCKI